MTTAENMPERMTASEPLTDAGIASAERGLVLLDGPDGVAVTLTAEAAAETGRRLIAAAEVARRQDRDAGA